MEIGESGLIREICVKNFYDWFFSTDFPMKRRNCDVAW